MARLCIEVFWKQQRHLLQEDAVPHDKTFSWAALQSHLEVCVCMGRLVWWFCNTLLQACLSFLLNCRITLAWTAAFFFMAEPWRHWE
jgi:hypothetical protein